MKTIPSIKTLIANLFLVCICFFSKTNVYATHIIGAEMSYTCLGSLTYSIKLKVYRDCANGLAPFDNPARITVWTGGGSPAYIGVYEFSFHGSTLLPYQSADTNWVPTGNICAEVSVYCDTITLPPSGSGYIFAYQRCCRNNTIVNLVDPGNTGGTYFETVPVSDLCNSSPEFNFDWPLTLCVDRPMNFDRSATDPDGDSLVYRLCSAYDGGTPSDPQPFITSQPPFSFVIYQVPYSSSYPMPGGPPLTIDAQTGQVNITPTQLGSFVVSICCDEYRGGVLIGSHQSDFTYTTTQCPYGIGIENYESIACEVYPNPTKDFVQIKSDQEIKVLVFDMVGKLVYQTINASHIQNISMIDWVNGVYMYRAYSSKGVSTGKLIKQ